MDARLGDLSAAEQRRRLAGPGLGLRLGPFTARIRTSLRDVAAGIRTLYPDFELPSDDAFVDFPIRVDPPASHRRWLRPQVLFEFDGQVPFKPLPRAQGLAMLEWGLNWCVANHSHRYLVLHAGVVARGERAALLPGDPGAGKSTLCAALMQEGWRLLSDELALVDTATGAVQPLPRPVGLKNESIGVIASRFPGAVLGPPCEDTVKGVVAHLRPPPGSVAAAMAAARPAWIVFPRFDAAAGGAALAPVGRGQALMRLVQNAFNYSVLGELGFETAADAVAASTCHELAYASLDEAVACFETLARG